jgi:FtsP/CotA-like multicopper oxidase with cupredoxin domain
MNSNAFTIVRLALCLCGLLMIRSGSAHAAIPGITGPTFNLTAAPAYVNAPDGQSIYVWCYADGAGPPQYPGPTLIVAQGDTVTVNLTNNLSVPCSIVFPGQQGVTSTGGLPGVLAAEAPPSGGTVSYSFVAGRPGTYMYQSGTRPELQTEMGLVGALIVRPATPDQAYEHPDSAYDVEFLFLETEMDPRVHELVETGRLAEVDNTDYFPVYWFLNGRSAPDTMLPAFTPLLPHQPYNCMPMMHPGEKMLLRLVSADRDLHPFHTHGNHCTVIARDGRLLESAPGLGADLAVLDFTITVPSGGTTDALFEWTGAQLGWDMYGHAHDLDNPPTGNFPGPEDVDHDGDGVMDTVPLEPEEYAPDHGKPFPVILPGRKDLTFGAFYSGSPFLGLAADLPPGEGGFNVYAGYFYMWHSHKEKEMTTNDVFPGGMMTMMVVQHHDVMMAH